MYRDYFFVLCTPIMAAIVTLITVPIVRAYSVRRGIVDEPDARRVNQLAIPRLGGVAIGLGILLATLTTILVYSLMGYQLGTSGSNINYFGIATGVLLIFLAGVLDDILQLSATVKLLIQCLASLVIIYSGVVFPDIVFLNWTISLGLLRYPITLFYLVAFTNMINLIDGLDGLSAGVISIVACVLIVFASSVGAFASTILLGALLGACLAFLRYNWHPASIFMGDSGSMSLGMLLGVASLMFLKIEPTMATFLAPLVALSFPILDTLCAIVRRVIARDKIGTADKSHTHHRFYYKYGHRKAVIYLQLLTAVFAGLSLVVFFASDYVKLVALVISFAICCALIIRYSLFSADYKHLTEPKK